MAARYSSPQGQHSGKNQSNSYSLPAFSKQLPLRMFTSGTVGFNPCFIGYAAGGVYANFVGDPCWRSLRAGDAYLERGA
jgi:hypothetical protein